MARSSTRIDAAAGRFPVTPRATGRRDPRSSIAATPQGAFPVLPRAAADGETDRGRQRPFPTGFSGTTRAQSTDGTAPERRRRRSDGGVARLVLAQAVAAVMTGGYARLPALQEAPPETTRATTREGDLSDSDSEDDAQTTIQTNRDCEPDAWGAVAPDSDRAAATRLRIGALRLWSNVIGEADPIAEAVSLVEARGAAAFCPAPSAESGLLLEELEMLIRRDEEDDLELETAEGATSDDRRESPEGALLELLARSPAYGATLFGLQDGGFLAVSRRGVATLKADGSLAEDVALDTARRWCCTNDTNRLLFDAERPLRRWPLAHARKTSGPAGSKPRGAFKMRLLCAQRRRRRGCA